MIPSGNLAFRLTARQRRVHRVVGIVMASTLPVGVGGGAVLLVHGLPIGAWWILAELAEVAYGLMLLNYARAVTECTPAGLRARTTRGRVREWPWAQVAGITVEVRGSGRRVIKRVTVTSSAGDRVRLVAPMYSATPGGQEEFTAGVQQIQDYRAAAAAAARTWGSH